MDKPFCKMTLKDLLDLLAEQKKNQLSSPEMLPLEEPNAAAQVGISRKRETLNRKIISKAPHLEIRRSVPLN